MQIEVYYTKQQEKIAHKGTFPARVSPSLHFFHKYKNI